MKEEWREDRSDELAERFARAPREADPRRDLWPGIEAALGPAAAGTRPGWARGLRVPLQAAAAIALFAGGVAVGQRWSAPAPVAPEVAVPRVGGSAEGPADPLAAAAAVQRTGSEYVAALARLGEGAAATSPARDQGVDAALSTLQGAAYELVRLQPEDPQTGRILYSVSEARAAGRGPRPTVRF